MKNIKSNQEHVFFHGADRRKLSRRAFLKLAAMAGLLVGCRPLKDTTTPTSAPNPSPSSPPTAQPTTAPTGTALPTAAPTTAPTAVPTEAPLPTLPEVIRFYPDKASTVVHTQHAGVWDGATLVAGALQEMLDTSITALTGLENADEAWAALFRPHERVAIKVNTIQGSSGWTHVPLVEAVTRRLQDVGIPPEQIVVFDRHNYELSGAGFTINQDGPGPRCYGTGTNYTPGWEVAGNDIRLSNVLLDCDALINMPIIKQHMYAGISFAMKNHYGTFDRPSLFHNNTGQAIPELNALAPIRDRTRLIIGDMLQFVLGDHWHDWAPGNAVLMSFDPVAHDAVALPLWSAVREANGGNPAAYNKKANAWLSTSTELGLGTHESEHIELLEIQLG